MTKFKQLILLTLIFLPACTTVKTSSGTNFAWFSPIPFDKNKPGSPSSVRTGVKVYSGTVNGVGVVAIVPR